MVEVTQNNEIIKQYLAFSLDLHAAGSNAAPSYVQALKKIDTALHFFNIFLSPD